VPALDAEGAEYTGRMAGFITCSKNGAANMLITTAEMSRNITGEA
jgi:hypothetical protein